MTYGIIDSGGFITAMRHAVGTFGIVAGAITIPLRFFHQCFECRRIPLVHEQVTGLLPTEHITRWVAPGCATVSLVTGKKIQKQARVIEPPAALLAQLENISEQLFARIALDENVLLGRMLVIKTRRNGYPLHSERHRVIEKGCHLLRGLALEQSAVNRYPKPPLDRHLNCLYSFIKYSRAAD